jgi:hypothetical protein
MLDLISRRMKGRLYLTDLEKLQEFKILIRDKKE